MVNTSDTSEQNSLEPRKTSAWRQIAALVRFLAFLALLIATTIAVVPFEKFPYAAYLGAMIGGFLVLAVLGTVVYFFFAERGPALIATTIDLESMAALVIGIITIIIFGVVTLMSAETPRVLLLGFILLGIYLYYVYRIIKENIRIMRENEDIRRQYGELREMDQEKTNFITVTSHQLRTPLTETKWALESLLRQSGLSEPLRSSLQRVSQSTQKIMTIVEDILQARATGKTTPELRRADTDLTALLQEIAGELYTLAEQIEVSLVLTPPEKPCVLSLDRTQIKRAIANVIDNAIRYSPKGSVSVTLRQSGGSAVIQIKDTGIGITVGDYQRVFKKFFRGENALLVQPDGLGLGLYNAKRIIEEHGGTIDFTSVTGKGTTFTITLPVK